MNLTMVYLFYWSIWWQLFKRLIVTNNLICSFNWMHIAKSFHIRHFVRNILVFLLFWNLFDTMHNMDYFVIANRQTVRRNFQSGIIWVLSQNLLENKTIWKVSISLTSLTCLRLMLLLWISCRFKKRIVCFKMRVY